MVDPAAFNNDALVNTNNSVLFAVYDVIKTC